MSRSRLRSRRSRRPRSRSRSRSRDGSIKYKFHSKDLLGATVGGKKLGPSRDHWLSFAYFPRSRTRNKFSLYHSWPTGRWYNVQIHKTELKLNDKTHTLKFHTKTLMVLITILWFKKLKKIKCQEKLISPIGGKLK